MPHVFSSVSLAEGWGGERVRTKSQVTKWKKRSGKTAGGKGGHLGLCKK